MSPFFRSTKLFIKKLGSIFILLLNFFGEVLLCFFICSPIIIFILLYVYSETDYFTGISLDTLFWSTSLLFSVIISIFRNYHSYKEKKDFKNENVLFNCAFKEMLQHTKYKKRDFKGKNEKTTFELKKQKIFEFICNSYDSYEKHFLRELISFIESHYNYSYNNYSYNNEKPYYLYEYNFNDYKKLTNPQSETFQKMVHDHNFQISAIIELGKMNKRKPFYEKKQVFRILNLLPDTILFNLFVNGKPMEGNHFKFKMLIVNYLCMEFDNYELRNKNETESYSKPNWSLIFSNLNSKKESSGYPLIMYNWSYSIDSTVLYLNELEYLDKIIDIYGSSLSENEAHQEMRRLVDKYSKVV